MEMLADAVFEGGGIKGIGLVGALSSAEKRGYRWRYVAGTSAGAIVASLVAAGFTAEEIRSIMESTSFGSFLDKGLLTTVPIIGPFLNLTFFKGIFRGKVFEDWIRYQLSRKGIYKFRQLRVPGVTEEKFAYKLRVIAADISREQLLILPQDARRYGIDPDELEVARAIRMSMSIPFFYQPVKVNYQVRDKKCVSYIVDGGILSNFPLWIFDGTVNDVSCPTFGFRLHAPVYGVENRIKGPLSMLKALFSTMMEAHDQKYIEKANFSRSIMIPCLGTRTTDFDISREKQQALFKSGYDAAEKFFANWNYDHFISRYGIL